MKVIITDLDRTLLKTDKNLSEHTIQIMQECRRRGYFVMAATARPARAIRPYMKAVHFNAVTTLNGARTILMDHAVDITIPRESVLSIIEKLMKIDDITISVETEEGIFSNKDIPDWMPTVYDNLLTAPLPENIYKIIVSSASTDLSNLLPASLTPDTYCSVANGELYQILASKATKWNGVLTMLREYGLSAEDAIYFGDDNDDIEAMQNSKIGVAVSNAIPDVLAIADAVTSSNDEDGVAEYIEKLLFIDQPSHGRKDILPH